MTRSVCALGAILGSLTGCILIPDIGEIDKLEVPPALSSPMAAGDKLAILGDETIGDDDNIVTCVRSAAAKADTALKMMPPQDFRDALFPWFEPSTIPRTAEQLALSMSQPAVYAKISALNLHYAVIVEGATSSSGDSVNLVLGGVVWEAQTTRLSGRILDLREARRLGSIDVSVSEDSAGAVIGLLPVGTVPVTEGPACRELGRQLAAYLTGRPVSKPEPARTKGPGQ